MSIKVLKEATRFDMGYPSNYIGRAYTHMTRWIGGNAGYVVSCNKKATTIAEEQKKIRERLENE